MAHPVPSTKTWLVVLSLLTTLLLAERHAQLTPGTPPALAGRPVAPAGRRVVLASPVGSAQGTASFAAAL